MKHDENFSQRFEQLTQSMRGEWDRRVAHDYRYWMSDGVESDAAMWQAGFRDFEILSRGIDPANSLQQTALEIGCGVGRLLRPASALFKKVYGVDVSEQALQEGGRLLHDRPNVERVLSNGFTLKGIPNNSIDFVYTFAALSSMPVVAIASYLVEASRVLRPGSLARLQVYLGKYQQTCEVDSIAIRSFEKERFLKAVEAAGFVVETVEELKLPFSISDYEAGQVAEIVSVKKSGVATMSVVEIAELLVEGKELQREENWAGSITEYYMAVARAQQHLDAGEAEEARTALEFATRHYENPEKEICEILQKLRGAEYQATPTQSAAFSDGAFGANAQVLNERFPGVWNLLKALPPIQGYATETSPTGEPVIVRAGTPLDNRQKPVRAGSVWAEQAINAARAKKADAFVVVGFAGGYHLEALLKATDKPVYVIEPCPETLQLAFSNRNLTSVLSGITLLTTDIQELVKVLESSESWEMLIHPQTQAVEPEFADSVRRAIRFSNAFSKLHPSIGVVGPLYGGSLPMAQYATNSLLALRQRTRGFRLEEFYPGYTHIGGYIQEKNRRSGLEDKYVEMISQVVLESVLESSIDILICLAQAPMTPRVLTELRKRGVITAMWFVEDCRMLTTWKKIAPFYDYLFLIQENGYPQLAEAAGARRAIYLPVGCDPKVHRPLKLTEQEHARWGSTISFLGTGFNNRQQVFATLADMDFKIWGDQWPKCPPFNRLVQENGRRLDPEDYVKIFNATKINLNLHSSLQRDGVEPNGDFVNPRTLEIAACKAFQLVDERLPLGSMFDIGTEMITYRNRHELREKIEHYSRHPEQAHAIAERSYARVMKEHTYEHRLKEMLTYIYADNYEHLKSREQQDPWVGVMERAEKYPELKKRLLGAQRQGFEPTVEVLAAQIQCGKGALSDVEQKILFLHHLVKQVDVVEELRGGKAR